MQICKLALKEALSEGFSVQLNDLNLSSVRFSGLLARLLGVPPARLGGALPGLIGPFFGLGGPLARLLGLLNRP